MSQPMSQKKNQPEIIRNFIGGKWLPADGGKTFPSYNPATGEVVGHAPVSTVRDVEKAVEAAHAAFPAWRQTPAPKRGEILFKAAEILVTRKEELARLLTQEMGKVLAEARGDIQEAIDMAYYMAAEGRRSFGQTVPSELANKFMMTVRSPLGVAACITPWNFPVAIPSWKVFPALILGNTVVLKPASDTPVVAAKFVEILVEAGVPAGVLNFLTGPGGALGKTLCTHPKVALVSFTGSTDVGKGINAMCAPSLKRISMEMGGKNAILVMADADLDLAVDGIVWSAFGTSGQRCTAASRIIVERGIYPALTSKLLARTRKLRLGNGLDPKTEVGPVINRSQLQKIHEYVQIGQKEDRAKLLCGGQIEAKGPLAKGCFYQPTLFGDVRPEMRIAQEEIFGPVTALIPVRDFDEAIRVANGTRYGLSMSIFSKDVNKAFRAMRDLESGLVYVNAGTIGAEVQVPFGGMKETGNGHRDAGQSSLDTFSEWKSLFVDFSGRLQRAQID